MFLNSTQQNRAYSYARSRQAYTVSLNPFYVMRPIFDMLTKVVLMVDEKPKKRKVKVK